MSDYLAIASAKGGVGKTTIATNIASILSENRQDVLLADFNMHSPDILHHMGSPDTNNTIIDVLKGHIPLSGAVYQLDKLKMIPAAQHSHSEEHFRNLIKLMPELSSHADWIVADFPARIDAHTITLLSAFDKVVIAATPDSLSMRRASQLKNMLPRHVDASILLNMVRSRHPTMTSTAEGHIPYDPQIHEALEKGISVSKMNPYAASSHALRAITSLITGIEIKRPSYTKITSLLR